MYQGGVLDVIVLPNHLHIATDQCNGSLYLLCLQCITNNNYSKVLSLFTRMPLGFALLNAMDNAALFIDLLYLSDVFGVRS